MMISLVDSHCHLDHLNLDCFEKDLPEVLKEANLVGVHYFLSVGVELKNLSKIISIAEHFPHVYASVGLHPAEKDDGRLTKKLLFHEASHPKVLAIGETGLDYHHQEVAIQEQKERFKLHIQVARDLGKPLIIHTRDSAQDTLRILRSEKAEQIGGVMHCFTESLDIANQALDLGFYISFSGIITFKNAPILSKVAEKIPLERILIETDSPYLAPVPHRGKPNRPAYVRYVAQRLAEIKQLSLEEVARQTTQNFFQLFKIDRSV